MAMRQHTHAAALCTMHTAWTLANSAAADESFFWIQIPILLLLMNFFRKEQNAAKSGMSELGSV